MSAGLFHVKQCHLWHWNTENTSPLGLNQKPVTPKQERGRETRSEPSSSIAMFSDIPRGKFGSSDPTPGCGYRHHTSSTRRSDTGVGLLFAYEVRI
jgi:hypothetical protein